MATHCGLRRRPGPAAATTTARRWWSRRGRHQGHCHRDRDGQDAQPPGHGPFGTARCRARPAAAAVAASASTMKTPRSQSPGAGCPVRPNQGSGRGQRLARPLQRPGGDLPPQPGQQAWVPAGDQRPGEEEEQRARQRHPDQAEQHLQGDGDRAGGVRRGEAERATTWRRIPRRRGQDDGDDQALRTRTPRAGARNARRCRGGVPRRRRRASTRPGDTDEEPEPPPTGRRPGDRRPRGTSRDARAEEQPAVRNGRSIGSLTRVASVGGQPLVDGSLTVET